MLCFFLYLRLLSSCGSEANIHEKENSHYWRCFFKCTSEIQLTYEDLENMLPSCLVGT